MVHSAIDLSQVNQEALSRLEFPRVRALLVDLAASYRGRELLSHLAPHEDRAQAERDLHLVDALRRRAEEGASLPRLEIAELRPVFARLASAGAFLEAPEFMALGALLSGIRETKRILGAAGAAGAAGEAFPRLADLAVPLLPHPHLERALAATFDTGGEILDSASPDLRRIRRETESRRERLRSRMERVASRLTEKDAVSLVTLREGRYVVAVPQDRRGSLQGLVLDRSASGSTVYMEPLEAVEENNALRELEAEERQEIRRILADLAGRFAAVREALAADWERLGEVDALTARARLAQRWHGEVPVFTDGPRLRLRGARHPLLFEARRPAAPDADAWSSVIPLEVDLEVQSRILLLTGPNMGGKTVALKCVGLLSVLAQCGCLIPAEAGAELPWIQRWVVSLGDEQSLEADLSTFASHLRRWAEALAAAGPSTLVLLDELGSGTDPAEGAALAQSVLERLLEEGALGLVTTHLGSLKAFAAEAPGIRNASMIFDPQTRRPTYVLAAGLPGESHALVMARRLGFPEAQVARAEALLPTEVRDIRRLLEELTAERTRVAALREETTRARDEAERLQEERRAKLTRLLEERNSVRVRAAQEARALVRRAEDILRGVEREAKASKRVTSVTRQDLQREAGELARIAAPRPRPVGGRPPREVHPGERYWAVDLEREVEVLRAADAAGRVLVVQKGIRVELPLSELRVVEAIPDKEPEATAPRGSAILPEVESMSTEVDLRGLRVDEALDEVDRAIDRAMLAGLRELRLIHGKGTGALRQAVTEHCRKHPQVTGTRIADQNQGGLGATEITLEE